MAPNPKEILAKIVAENQAKVNAFLEKIVTAESIEALESILIEDDSTTLVYANATPKDQQKIDFAVEERAALLA